MPFLEGESIYSFDADNLHLPFAFSHDSNGSTQVTELSNLIKTILEESENVLLAGDDVEIVQDRLASLRFEEYFEPCERDFHRW